MFFRVFLCVFLCFLCFFGFLFLWFGFGFVGLGGDVPGGYLCFSVFEIYFRKVFILLFALFS